MTPVKISCAYSNISFYGFINIGFIYLPLSGSLSVILCVTVYWFLDFFPTWYKVSMPTLPVMLRFLLALKTLSQKQLLR
jgi:hypothetical protein